MVGHSLRSLVLGSLACVLCLAGPAMAQTRKLGTFGGWEIGIVHDKGRFVRCVADTTGPDNEGLRLNFGDDGKRHILPGPGTSALKDEAVIVLRPSGRRFTFAMVAAEPGRLRSPVLENGFTDVFFESKRMDVQLPARNVTRNFDLGDPDAMSARIDGCVSSHQ